MTTLNRTELYCCPYCAHTYQRPRAFEKHVLCCKILSKPIKCTIEDDVPTVRELYTIIQELTKNLAGVKQELTAIKKWVTNRKKQVNVIAWLNKNNNLETNYFQWLDSLVLQRKHLEFVFEHNYIEGLLYIFQDLLPLDKEKSLPIKSFEQKKGTLFIYDNENKWRMMESEEFGKLTNILSRALTGEFQKWKKEHDHELYTDSFSKKYSENVKKVLGGNLSYDVMQSRIKSKLYNHLKYNLKHIVEYEFTL